MTRSDAGSRTAATVAAAAALAVLAGCTDPDLGPAPDEDGTGGDGGTVEACDDEVLAAIDEVIAGQLAAFAADDFATALDFASRDFQASIDAEAFEALIEEGYPVAADATEHESQDCLLAAPDRAEVRVEVTGADGTRGQLAYLVVDEDDTWRIAGAVELRPAPGTVV